MHYGPQYGHGAAFPHPPPPDPPERPEGSTAGPRWPAWYGPAALGIGLVLALVGGQIVFVVAGGDPKDPTPAVVQIATVIQDAAFVGAAILLASQTLAPRAWHFGLRRDRLGPAVGWVLLGLVSFVAFEIGYSRVVTIHEKQKIVEDLGANDSGVALVAGALLVIAIAPFAEEFFFRGFFYRALRNRMGIALAAGIDGLVFGAIHIAGSPVAVLPVLAVLGAIFCLVYERTGTLFAPIAMHALNNFAAYGSATERWDVSGAVGAAMVGACVLVPGLLPGRRPAPS
ncbi:MAG TPA: CPBP family intramembrane glutamic endopeptidase [Thermoleophilaceae bacterium]